MVMKRTTTEFFPPALCAKRKGLWWTLWAL